MPKSAIKRAAPRAIPSAPPHTAAPHAAEPEPLNYHTNINFWHGRVLSFRAALAGVAYTVRTQPNAWIELLALSVVALAGWWFGIRALEWGLLGMTIAVVLAFEAMNTAVEAVVDLVSPGYHPLAKIAKDTAAGALIFVVLGSIAVAASIFLPRIWAWWF